MAQDAVNMQTEVTMKRVLIEFDKLPWESPGPGVRYKAFVSGTQQLRLLEFSEGFEEKEWCTKGHAFYVLDGLLLLRTKDGVVRMKAGQIGFLDAGEASSHKVIMEPGERALLLLFEVLAAPNGLS
jgi:quercetin dioxygenase-like cupin family protein